MHATHTGSPLRAALPAALALSLVLGAGPALSQTGTQKEPPTALAPTTEPAPPAESAPAAPTPSASTPGIVFDSSSQNQPEPKVTTDRSPAIELSRSVPFIGRRSNTRILSGYYIFSDRNRGNLSGIHPGSELPLILRIQLEENYSRRSDIHRRTGIVGLWASVPIFENSHQRHSRDAVAEPTEPPNRTLVAAIGTDTSRHRTSRKPEADLPGQGFFSRLRPHTGILERSKSDRAISTVGPVKPEPSPVAPAPETTPTAEKKKEERGGPIDFLRRIRD